MGEIKQTNFRIDSECAEAFRAFCDENGYSQAQGFEHIMNVLALNQAKEIVPGRKVEIEEFERYAKKLLEIYVNSVALAKDAEERIREEFHILLESKDNQIIKLQKEVEEKNKSFAMLNEACQEADKREKEAETKTDNAMKSLEKAENIIKDKENIIEMLTLKLTEVESKLSDYPMLKKVEEQWRIAEQKNVDIQRDAEISKEREVAKLQRKMDSEIIAIERKHYLEVQKLRDKIGALMEKREWHNKDIDG